LEEDSKRIFTTHFEMLNNHNLKLSEKINESLQAKTPEERVERNKSILDCLEELEIVFSFLFFLFFLISFSKLNQLKFQFYSSLEKLNNQ